MRLCMKGLCPSINKSVFWPMEFLIVLIFSYAVDHLQVPDSTLGSTNKMFFFFQKNSVTDVSRDFALGYV